MDLQQSIYNAVDVFYELLCAANMEQIDLPFLVICLGTPASVFVGDCFLKVSKFKSNYVILDLLECIAYPD